MLLGVPLMSLAYAVVQEKLCESLCPSDKMPDQI